MTSAEEYYYLGNKYKDEKEYIKAISYYTKAIELGYNDADIYRKRGFCHLNTQQYNKAIDDFTEAINIQHKDSDYSWRSICYMHLGMDKEAKADEIIYQESCKKERERANELFKEIDEVLGNSDNREVPELNKAFYQIPTKGRKLDL